MSAFRGEQSAELTQSFDALIHQARRCAATFDAEGLDHAVAAIGTWVDELPALPDDERRALLTHVREQIVEARRLFGFLHKTLADGFAAAAGGNEGQSTYGDAGVVSSEARAVLLKHYG